MDIQLFMLIISVAFLLLILYFLNRKKKTLLLRLCSYAIILMVFWCTFLVLQILLSSRLGIRPEYFDYVVYISACFLPLVVFFIGKCYSEGNIEFNKKMYLLFIIPMIELIIIWTNDFHKLVYIEYSTNLGEAVMGPYMYVHSIIEYSFIILGGYYLLRSIIKNSGFFSKQVLVLLFGISIPTIVNILGTWHIIQMTIYLTPICFSFALIMLIIAIVRFNFLEVVPIAIEKIVDNISDSYVVLNENNTIIDLNKPFNDTFKIGLTEIRGLDFFYLLKRNGHEEKIDNIKHGIEKGKISAEPSVIVEYFENIDKIFSIEISSIYSNDEHLATILLFKDITEHTKDLKRLEENQYIMQRQAQFSILGEFAGGLAHDLNSPLSSVQLDMSTLQKYIKSDKIEATPEVKAIILEMMENIDSSLNKMTKIIAGVRNQIRATGNTEKEYFDLKEMVDGIEILFGSILRKNNCKIQNMVNENITIYGEKNKLDRVIGNVIKNSIDAYVGRNQKGTIVVFSKIIDDNCIIGIQDEAGGMDEDVAKTMFKEMKTTKDENGTGFGLYYSNTIIESSFNGKMTFETEPGKGTIFYINIPMVKEDM